MATMKLSKVDAIVRHSACIITLNGRGAAAMVLVVVARLVLAAWLDVGVSVMLLLGAVLVVLVSLDLSGGSKVVAGRRGKIGWVLGHTICGTGKKFSKFELVK